MDLSDLVNSIKLADDKKKNKYDKKSKKLQKVNAYKEEYKNKEKRIYKNDENNPHSEYIKDQCKLMAILLNQLIINKNIKVTQFECDYIHDFIKIYSPSVKNDTNNKKIISDHLYNDVSRSENLSLLLQDLLNRNDITVTEFERYSIISFNTYISKLGKNIKKSRVNKFHQNIDCRYNDNCIVWNCRFQHTSNRVKECICEDETCKLLHVNQALCRNQNHSNECSMAHNLSDLR
jgi:hypothetical protein